MDVLQKDVSGYLLVRYDKSYKVQEEVFCIIYFKSLSIAACINCQKNGIDWQRNQTLFEVETF